MHERRLVLQLRTPIKRIEGLVTASQIPAASAASFFCRRTKGFTYADGIIRASWPSLISSRAKWLHEDDFAGHLIDKGFAHLSLAAIAEEDETHLLLRGLTHRRRKGEALFPERESLEILEEIRHEIGPYAFGERLMRSFIVELAHGIIKAGLAR